MAREVDPTDARRKRLRVTEQGFEMLREAEAIFDELRDRWAQQIGLDRLKALEAQLLELVGTAPVRLDTPGWIATRG